jgi:hypothetical protein
MAMKYAIFLLTVLLCHSQSHSQGTSCSSPISLNLNGVITNFSTSSSTGAPVVCSAYTTTSPVTWFAFTTSATAECPLISISASDNNTCEIAFYTDCGGNMNNNLDVTSSMCFDDGQGLWAPSETFPLQPNHTYYLRVKTSSACTLSIGGQFYSPSNNKCSGATSITTTSFRDNNSCHRPSGEVTPGQLCAFTLENTAFYKFVVASAGQAIINISSISCDNGDGNNSNGFQIGFFTGSCSNLTPINCTNGSGSFVQATTTPLPAGAFVYVAIDGVSGSNCQYSIVGINVWGVLSTNFKNFSAWKTASGNSLRWTCFSDNSAYYIVERSNDGYDFYSIGQVNHPNNYDTKSEYSFEDTHPLRTSFYRVKQVAKNGDVLVSQVVTVVRSEIQLSHIRMESIINSSLLLQIESDVKGKYQYAIINASGQQFFTGTINYTAGIIQFYKETSSLPAGKYSILLYSKEGQTVKNFIKLN